MKQHARRTPGKGSAIRRLALPTLVCGVLCALIARPAYADPVFDDSAPGSGSGVSIPDTGAVPIPAAPVTGPSTGQSATSIPTVTGPFGSQIMAQYATLEATGEKLKQAGIDLDQAKQTATDTYQAWQAALANAARLQQKADNEAAEAYKDAAGLGPYADFANDVHQLGMLAPGLASQSGQNTSETAAQDANQARQQANIDEEAYRAALDAEQKAADTQTSLQTSYDQQSAALDTLRETNEAQVEAAEAAQAASDRSLNGLFAAGTQVNGMVANPKALAALSWAYAQATANPPKWYKFGAEGPDFFDCSGLTWASYRSTGYTLPRVAADQYHGTSASRIPATQLLPGDLLFFSTTSKTDWTSISHVAIYFGDNLMVEAAHEGTPVRVSQVWWSAFFGATRVYPAVPAPKPSSGSPTSSPTHSTQPTPPPTGSTPTPTPTDSSPTPTPTATEPTPSPTGSTPTPTPTTPTAPPGNDPTDSSTPPSTPTDPGSSDASAPSSSNSDSASPTN